MNFKIRNFLDNLDGIIYRAHVHQSEFNIKSNYGSFGYLVDIVSDALGGACLCVAIFFYLLKHRPTIEKSNNKPNCFWDTIDTLEMRWPESSATTSLVSSTNNNETNKISRILIDDLNVNKRCIFFSEMLKHLKIFESTKFRLKL